MPGPLQPNDFRASLTPALWREVYWLRPARWGFIGLLLGLVPSACLWCGAWLSGLGH